MSCSIFPIVAFHNVYNTFQDCGTGFFINNNGLFITAAHTFKNESNNYFALINNIKYSIKEIYSEYIESGINDEQLYFDFFIGTVNTKPVNTIGINCLSKNVIFEVSKINGYKTKEKLPVCSYDDFLNESNIVSEIIYIPQIIDLVVNINYQDNVIQKFDEFQNTFTFNILKAEIDNVLIENFENFDFGGISGAPIVNDDKLVGMLIRKFVGLSQNYIYSKLKSLSLI